MTITKSTTTDQIIKALIQARTQISNIAKNRSAKMSATFSYKYSDLAECINSVQQPLLEANIFLTQHVTAIAGIKHLTTSLLHESEQFIESCMPIDDMIPKNVDNYSQALGKAITYAKRYALISILGLNSSDDDDDAQSLKKNMNSSSRIPSNLQETQEKQNQEKIEIMTKFNNLCLQNNCDAQEFRKFHQIRTLENFKEAITKFVQFRESFVNSLKVNSEDKKAFIEKNNYKTN